MSDDSLFVPTLSIEISDFDYDKRKDGWKLVKNKLLDKGRFNLNLLAVPQDDSRMSNISCAEVLRRIKNRSEFAGQHHAEYLLRRQYLIPDLWRDYFLVFPGTQWRTPDGDLGDEHLVLQLHWIYEAWDLGWLDLDDDEWTDDLRLVFVNKAL